jgi:Domain of unknown function (DUF4062)
MSRIFRIFISSTQKDLKDERKAVIEQVLQAGHIPSGMEMFNAGNTEDLRVIEHAIDQCDVYVVIVGARFGSTKTDDTGVEKSFTQIEFEYATRAKKPILGFLMGDAEFKKKRDALPADDVEKPYEERLRLFRETVRSKRIVDFFGKDREGIGGLKACFHAALIKLIQEDEEFRSPGLTPYDPDAVSLGVAVGNNPFLRDIIDRLKGYSVLADRCTKHSHLKRGMAAYFRHQCLASIIDSGFRDLFFESGSTVAYLSAEFSRWLSTQTGQKYFEEWHIRTNNILTYLHFVLTKNIKLELFPYGPPERRYGATFGDIAKLPRYPAPGRWELPASAQAAVEEMADSLTRNSRRTLFLATASGLDLDKETPIGPHVGDYFNKLFKRAIFSTKCPVVLFLDEWKLSEPYNNLHCFPVCDSSMSWQELCESVPLALCIGTESAVKRAQIIDQIGPFGFEHVDPIDPMNPEKKYEGCWPLLASNRLFGEHIETLGLQVQMPLRSKTASV